jgi:peptidoglycan/xylan/chitin deacetylase (PgdA/CDA1 family)
MRLKTMLLRTVLKYRRTVAERLYCRIVTIKPTKPIISFSFDDAPRTAFCFGGDILKAHGAVATFYVSLGLLGSQSHSGTIAFEEDLRRAVAEGHELGCHTFDHKNSWETSTEVFVKSVVRNRRELSRILPAIAFNSFAYPFCMPRPKTKRRVGELFTCCRGEGQTFNVGSVDMNFLKSFFLDSRTEITIDAVKSLIDMNAERKGWLIFATHDVNANPYRYGCSTKFFRKAVTYAVNSGACLLPVGKACNQIQAGL